MWVQYFLTLMLKQTMNAEMKGNVQLERKK